jgi:hypothetical protein
VLFKPQGCTITAVSESLQAFNLLFGFLGRLDFLGYLCFCCPLLRGFLRALLVGCLGFGLCTTGLALRALSVVFAYTTATTLLANIAYSVVLANARTTALLALRALSVVFTDARATTLLAIIAPPVVMAYARATTLLAL